MKKILTKVRSKKQVIDEARTSGATVHFASLMDICHLKNAELEAKHQKYKGRVVLRGDIVKDDSGSYAVFTEQGSSASQMTATKIMDIISRLPGCDGQAADAVSAYTQVKMEDAHKLLNMSRHLDSSSTTQMALNHIVQYVKTQSFLLKDIVDPIEAWLGENSKYRTMFESRISAISENQHLSWIMKTWGEESWTITTKLPNFSG